MVRLEKSIYIFLLNQYNKTSHLMYVNSMFCCILFVLKKMVLFFFFALCCFIWFCFAFVFCISMLCFFAYFAFCCFAYSCFVLFYCVLFSFSCFVLFYVVFSNSRPLQGLEGFKRMHAWLKDLHFLWQLWPMIVTQTIPIPTPESIAKSTEGGPSGNTCWGSQNTKHAPDTLPIVICNCSSSLTNQN